MKTPQEILSAAKYVDWRMVIVNGGPPCFHVGNDGLFCGLSERWQGHCHPGDHDFVSLTNLLESMETYARADLLDRLQKAEQQLKEAVELLGVSKCPNCDGSGSYAIEGTHGEAQECQCQFCFEKNALLASADARTDLLDRLDKLEKQLKEAVQLLTWPNASNDWRQRCSAFLKEQNGKP